MDMEEGKTVKGSQGPPGALLHWVGASEAKVESEDVGLFWRDEETKRQDLGKWAQL